MQNREGEFSLKIKLVLFAVVLVACSSDPVGSVYGETRKYGLVEISEAGEAYDLPNSISGKAFANAKISVVEETRYIPLELGVTFGHEWCGYGMPQGPIHLKYWILHPDDGEGSFGYIRDTIVENQSPDGYCTTDAYTLDSERELLPGEWTLRISYHDEGKVGTTLVSNTFYVGQTEEP